MWSLPPHLRRSLLRLSLWLLWFFVALCIMHFVNHPGHDWRLYLMDPTSARIILSDPTK
jgi:hypothetical protein